MDRHIYRDALPKDASKKIYCNIEIRSLLMLKKLDRAETIKNWKKMVKKLQKTVILHWMNMKNSGELNPNYFTL